MASGNRRLDGMAVGAGLLGMLLGTSVALATDVPDTDRDVGVPPSNLVVVERLTSTSTARVTFVAKDAGMTNGRAVDVEGIRARLHVEYGDGAAAGAFVIPPGTTAGWVRNDAAATVYRNLAAPDGATEMRSIVVRPGGLLKLRGAGLGDTPLDIAGAGPPTGSIYVSLEIVEAGITTRLCSEVQNCGYGSIESGGGAKLTCLGGVADPSCRAAHPAYVSGEDVRYGGAGTLAIIGDSITVQASVALKEALADRWFVHVRAKGGSMFRDLQQAGERIGQSNPQVVVINLGTNDFGCLIENAFTPDTPCRFPDFDSDAFLADARAMIASVAGACVIGTTTWFGDVGSLWSNMVATGELAGVVQWQEYLNSLSVDERQLLLADGLGHLTPAGTVALAEMTAQVVAESCGASP